MYQSSYSIRYTLYSNVCKLIFASQFECYVFFFFFARLFVCCCFCITSVSKTNKQIKPIVICSINTRPIAFALNVSAYLDKAGSQG